LGIKRADVVIFGTQDMLEGMGKPLVGIYLMHFTSSEQRVDHRCPPGAGMGAGEQVIIPPESNRTNGIFHLVIIDFQQTIGQVTAEGLPRGQAVGKRLPDLAFRQHVRELLGDPFPHLRKDA